MSRILLCASASVAVYKACDLASKLTQAGHEVGTLLTPRAAELVSPQLFEAVTGKWALVDEYSERRRGAMDHIDAARLGELVADGWELVDAEAGHMACGEHGSGRLAEPATIQARIDARLS